MRGSCSVVGGWKEERTGVAFVDMLKPEAGALTGLLSRVK